MTFGENGALLLAKSEPLHGHGRVGLFLQNHIHGHKYVTGQGKTLKLEVDVARVLKVPVICFCHCQFVHIVGT